MTFYAKKPKLPFFLFAFLGILGTLRGSSISEWWVFLIGIVLTLINLLAIFINYDLTLKNNSLTYRVYLFKLVLYKRTIQAEQISEIALKRFGWSKKGTVLKIIGSNNLRLVDFSPENFYEQLVRFAEKNNLSISKTKDYIILDKLNKDK